MYTGIKIQIHYDDPKHLTNLHSLDAIISPKFMVLHLIVSELLQVHELTKFDFENVGQGHNYYLAEVERWNGAC